MLRSLYSGVSGLKTHQTKMDVIGNNIANVNTVGFKSNTVTFKDLLYQTSSSAVAANNDTGRGGQNAKQVGLGVQLGAISTTITTAGGSQSTGNPFDLRINGDSFFVVNNGSGNYFTKAGDFTVDERGSLVTSAGYYVQGWQSDDEGNIIRGPVSNLDIMSSENLTTDPEITTDGLIEGNIYNSDESLKTEAGYTFSMSLFDNLGYEYDVAYTLQPIVTGEDDAGNEIYSTNQYVMNISKVTRDGETLTDDGEIKGLINGYDDILVTFTEGSNGGKIETLQGIEVTGTGKNNSIIGYNTLGSAVNPAADKLTLTFAEKNAAAKDNNGYIAIDTNADTTTVEYYATDNGKVYTLDATTSSYILQEEYYYNSSNNTLYERQSAAVDPAPTIGAEDADGKSEITGSTELDGWYVKDDVVYNASGIAQTDYFVETGALMQYTSTFNPITTDLINGNVATNEFSYSVLQSLSDGAYQTVGADAGTYNTNVFAGVSLDFSGITNYGSKSTMSAEKGDSNKEGRGRTVGNMSSIGIQTDGKIVASYDTGVTKILGQIAVATFANASGLEKMGENLYAETLNSGAFDGVGQDVTSDGGSFTVGVLEMSNVDLSTEFTDMIITQRGFQSNSRIITTSDSMLEELLSLKR